MEFNQSRTEIRRLLRNFDKESKRFYKKCYRFQVPEGSSPEDAANFLLDSGDAIFMVFLEYFRDALPVGFKADPNTIFPIAKDKEEFDRLTAVNYDDDLDLLEAIFSLVEAGLLDVCIDFNSKENSITIGSILNDENGNIVQFNQCQKIVFHSGGIH
jgi:hypothetical protein